jgi:proteasome accessory factor B
MHGVADRVERLTELLMLLLDTPIALTFDEIVQRAELYAGRDESSRKSFERDKASLRSLGIEITTDIDEGDRGATRYRIDPKSYFLPDLDLNESERMALHFGASMVRLDAAWDDAAVLKLGDAEQLPLPAVVAEMPSLDALPILHGAIQARALATFNYNGKARSIEGHGLFYREGHWYLSGNDSGTDKVFRVDRIDGDVTVGDSNVYELPDDFDPSVHMPSDPLLIGEGDQTIARVLVDQVMAARVERLRGGGVIARHDDGSIEVEVPVRNRDAFRSWVLGLRDHATVLAPPELVDDVVSWLNKIAGVS